MAKQPAPKKMTLKKQVIPKKVLVHPYKVRFGTRNELGPERQFATEVAARTAIIAAFNEWKPWCERYNHVGIATIEEAAGRVGSIGFHREPDRLECVFDEDTGMHVCVEFWTTR